MKKINKIAGLILAILLTTNAVFAQVTNNTIPKNWHQLDKAADGYYGISLNKAYDFIKAHNLKSKTVLVAVIDSGVDTTHEDLQGVLWTNPKEIPGNGIDDDHDGYVDDIHGWNFLGGKDGRNVDQDSYESARVYYALKQKYGDSVLDSSTVTTAEWREFTIYKKAQAAVIGDVNPAEIAVIKNMKPQIIDGDSVIMKDLGKSEYSCKDLTNYTSKNQSAMELKALMISVCTGNKTNDVTNKELLEEMNNELIKANDVDSAPEPYRKEIVKDDETNINDSDYGNKDIMASSSLHGTHCSGIIGAIRNNGKGVDGIADNVRIMMVRAVPNGDEHDKDIATAIRFAVDHGAEIISMSFGKDFSPQKQWVDDAVRYAESKSVLLIHAAGNDAKKADFTNDFPNPDFLDGKGKATNWISVGASGDPKNGGLTAYFSNYSSTDVNVFAPGVQIYSTLPAGNNYGSESGTSMACPVVAGIAALVLEYYPKLSAEQLKFIIEKTVQIPGNKVNIPGTDSLVNMSELCTSGGIVNAYAAIKFAAKIKGTRKKTDNNFIKPKEN